MYVCMYVCMYAALSLPDVLLTVISGVYIFKDPLERLNQEAVSRETVEKTLHEMEAKYGNGNGNGGAVAAVATNTADTAAATGANTSAPGGAA